MLTNIIFICVSMQIAFGRNAIQKEEREFDAGSDPGFDISRDDKENELSSQKQGCGIPQYTPNTFHKILSGAEARPNSWPWQVSVQNKQEGTSFYYFCGGTIISHNKVLSATHCFIDEITGIDKKFKNLWVVAGIHHLLESYTPTSQARKVIRLINHPNYNSINGFDNDISILYVDIPFIFNAKVQPACLPTSRVPDYTYCYATGWGSLWYGHNNNNYTLQQIKLPITSDASCLWVWGTKRFNSKKICAGYYQGGSGPCQGDSGGPFVCLRNGKWILDGIVSWGSKTCDKPGELGVYTRVSEYLPWINAN